MAITSGGSGGRQPMSEINVTPLVDVMLVLLIIFMVAAPMMKSGVPVDLPKTTAEPIERKPEHLLLSITSERKVMLGEHEVPRDRLEEALRTNRRLQEQGEIYVQADSKVPYGFVVRVFSAIRKAGIEKLGLVTNPMGSTAPAEGEASPEAHP